MDQIFIRIRTADRCQFRLAVSLHSSVAQLKELLSDRCKLPPARQKLIYQGRLLRDEEILDACRIETDHVIQLVSTVPVSASPLPPLLEPMPAQFHMEIRTTVPTAVLRTREEPTNHAAREIRLVALQQNLISLEGLMHCHTGQGFDFSRRYLFPGQWIDALDTVNQWLEAQVVEIQENRAFIHYNGWPSIWDEWIACQSPRVQLFASKTAWRPRQFRPAPSQSPSPYSFPDAEIALSPIDFPDMLHRAGKLLPRIYRLLRMEITVDTGEMMSLLLDRVGRLMSDIGGLMDTTLGGDGLRAMETSAALARHEDSGLSFSLVFQSTRD